MAQKNLADIKSEYDTNLADNDAIDTRQAIPYHCPYHNYAPIAITRSLVWKY